MANITTASSVDAVSARPELSIHNGIVTTTSLQVAQFFGKRHDNVLRAIRALIREMASEDRPLNFEETVDVRTNPSGGAPISTPAYRMTREGFMLLAMGFTGKEALRWKLAYIAAFNRMDAELQKPAQDPQRIQLAQRLATQAAAQVTQAVFDAVMAADNTDWRHARYLLNLGYDREGQPSVPHAQPIGDDQMIVSFNARPERIASGEILSATDAQLATLATACTQRLTQRAQHREKQAAMPNLPSAQPAPSLPSGTLLMTFK